MISTRSRNLLQRLLDSEDGELVRATPGGCWIDSHQVAARDVQELLRYCLISCEDGLGTDYEVFALNEDGRGVLSDKKYIPRIVRAFRENPRLLPGKLGT